MKTFLDDFLPRVIPGLAFICIPHEGKQDLEKSIPRKLRAWNEPSARFVVLRDNDGRDCRDLKRDLSTLCAHVGRSDVLIRIACQELEAWYFGDPTAMAEAFEDTTLSRIGKKARYRQPDAIAHPSKELERLVPSFQKISGARTMARFISCDRNVSRSFQVTMNGIKRAVESI